MLLLTSLTASALVAFAASSSAARAVDEYWNVEWVQDVNPDGLQPRAAIGVNGTWPPPILNVNASDVLRVHVRNQLNTGVGTALHSHGMFFNNTAWSDGAVAVTQCAIPPGETFIYEPLNSPSSPANRTKQYGTYWAHGHYMGQYVDGLRTPLVIHPEGADQHYKYDEDYTVVLGDWYHDLHHNLLTEKFLASSNPTGAEPVPQSALLYIASTPSNGSAAAYLPGFNENVTVAFVPGRTYRFRIINMSALAMFHFYIDGHDMRIIETDGIDTEETPVDSFPISAAQRYSVLVTARNDTTKDWKIHAQMDPDMFDVVPPELQLAVTARISYANTPQDFGEEKTFTGDSEDELPNGAMGFPYFDDTAIAPLMPEAPLSPSLSFNLSVAFNTYRDNRNYATFNDIVYSMPDTPSLLTQLTLGDGYGPTVNAFSADHLQVVEIVIINTDAGTHPFHLHGHAFQVVQKSMDVTLPAPEINANPMRRDTVVVPPGGSATLRFVADNPGAWFLHCHIEWHLQSGLAAVFLSSTPELQARMKPPSFVADQCRAQKISPTGNAAGINSTTDFGATQFFIPTMFPTGWTPNAVGTFVGCALAAIIGLGSVLYYGWSEPLPSAEL